VLNKTNHFKAVQTDQKLYYPRGRMDLLDTLHNRAVRKAPLFLFVLKISRLMGKYTWHKMSFTLHWNFCSTVTSLRCTPLTNLRLRHAQWNLSAFT